jgi:chorismate synthase
MKCLSARGITVTGKIIKIHGSTDPADWEKEIFAAQKERDSVGGMVEIVATGCPAGLGEPVFGKLDAQIAGAMMGIGAVKGVEIGDGFAAAGRFGSENNDQMTAGGFLSNHAGGILGGISTGEDIVVRIGVKPTPSVGKTQHTRDIHGNETLISVGGRHDPCIVPRIVPVAEAMLALVLIDCLLEQEKCRTFS